MSGDTAHYRYHFDPSDAIQDIDHLYCMRIRIQEPEVTLQGVQRMLNALYMQRRFEIKNIFMSPQDLRDMSITMKRKMDSYSDCYYFVYNDNDNNFPSVCIKRLWYGVGTPARVYPFEFLERGFVIVGFMPIIIEDHPALSIMNWGNWPSLLTDKEQE